MQSFVKNVRISPKKLNVVADLARGETVANALLKLQYAPKKGAAMIYKAVKSAAANAENNLKLDPATLKVGEVIVNKGMTLKRGIPGSRGRWKRIWKRAAHIWVKLVPKV